MGLFDRKKKTDGALSVESQDACAQASESQESNSQVAEAQSPEANAAAAQPTVAKATNSQVAEPQSAEAAAETGVHASRPDESNAPDSKPAAEWSAPVEPSSSGQLAKEPAISAPSLEHVIVTKSRDLSRLSREDLLQLLLTQSKDAERLQDYLRDVADEFERCTSLNERLREKLDVKDEQIERLKGRLDDKDKRIARMQARLDELEVSKEEERKHARIIVNAAEGVRGALEAFNVTADWYIASLQEVCGEMDNKSAPATPPAPPGNNAKAADE
ncbi:hypothetical protein [Adlercreutzia sp. ZJ141]|uniref:hypothetical protein n=1 Tax=Adlercreutzia sp. ZJ141 TaxID=2709406 RepID=UPI0013EC76C1|nr:hypothetical protein [Adlercreutzia sp. ZJ141]